MYKLRFIIFLFLLTACQEDTINPEISGGISGSVMDEEGKALQGVIVETKPPTSVMMTDSTGKFALEKIPAGEYAVTAQKAGYRNKTASISVTENNKAQVILTLEEKVETPPKGTLQGTIKDAQTNLPLANASITTAPPSVSLVTDAAGQFTIDSLAGGNYTIKVKRSGYQPDSVQIAVAAGKPTEIIILLEPLAQASVNLPSPPLPATLATGLSDSLTLRWKVNNPEENEALKFDVLLYASGDPVGKNLAENIADTSLVVTGLLYNTTYFWQVIAKDQQGNATVGELWSFQTRPFPDIKFLFNKRTEENQEIYGADESLQHKVRLTQQPSADVFPRLSPGRQWIAYVSDGEGKQQIYVMKNDGSEKRRVTELPVAGYHNYGEGFCWSPDGGQLLYSHYDKLYRINRDGTFLTLIATAPDGRHFKACDWSGETHKIAVQTTGTNITDSEIYLMKENGSNMELIVDNLPGRIENPSFSIDGKKLLFTQDVSGFVSATGRQLDTRIIMMDIDTGQMTDLSTKKPGGSNDTAPRFSPNGAYIIFENGSNEIGAPKSIWKMNLSGEDRQLLIENAEAPDWK